MADWSDVRVSTAGKGTLLGRADSTVSGGACTATVGGIQNTVRTVTRAAVGIGGPRVASGDTFLIPGVGSAYWAVGVAAAPPAVPLPTPTTPDVTPPDSGDSA